MQAVAEVDKRRQRILEALEARQVLYALVGGQAVAVWVATVNPGAVRTTKGVDLLIRREDLPRARAAALSVAMDYVEILGIGMFLERDDPNPKQGVHLIWAGERVRPDSVVTAPLVEEAEQLSDGSRVVSLGQLVAMKLTANRDQDRVHLRDLIDVELVGRPMLTALPTVLAERLELLLTEMGR